MVKKLADHLFVETDLPLKQIESFRFSWKTDCHGILHMRGYMDRSSRWIPGQLYESQIKIWLEQNGQEQMIFCGSVIQFACRLASQSGTCIIPDIVTGRPNIWFGMRKGQKVSLSSEHSYTVDLFPAGNPGRKRYQAEDRALFKIGDTVLCLNQKLIITEVRGCFERGELMFQYTMEDMAVHPANKCPDVSNAGLGLWGTVQEVKGELLKIALDIDCGGVTGEYFYRWQPETGNYLYAMPEPGARVLLYFYHENLKDGTVIHCLNKEMENRNYKNRSMDIHDGNQMHLWKHEIGLLKGTAHSITLADGHVSVMTQKGMELSGGAIFLRGKRIRLQSPETINISQE